MQSLGNPRGGDGATSLPSGFKYLVGAAAFFIAGCSAFFSVRGLGLLFIGCFLLLAHFLTGQSLITAGYMAFAALALVVAVETRRDGLREAGARLGAFAIRFVPATLLK